MLSSFARPRRALSLAVAAAATLSLAGAAQASAADQVVTEAEVVRQAENTPPLPTAKWVLYTRAGTPPTAGTFVDGPATPPLNAGSFQTSTPSSSEKVFLLNFEHVGKSLANAGDVGYSTYRTSGNGNQLPGLNLQVDFNGSAAGGFTTLVYEPVYNNASQPIVSGAWQTWDADAGRWWSTQPINNQCSGATISCMRTLASIAANNPDAVITGGVGINQGSGNPTLKASTDALRFGGATYDFERVYPDGDDDGTPDKDDNCPADANSDQTNSDDDADGDACDADDDNDGVADTGDNCSLDANTDQANNDGDTQGDVCDTDDDNDGVADGTDNCQTTANPDQADADGDGIGTACDVNESPATAADCKNGGWKAYTGDMAFKNQGDCVSFVATDGKNPPKG